jgi:hypothetical protein
MSLFWMLFGLGASSLFFFAMIHWIGWRQGPQERVYEASTLFHGYDVDTYVVLRSFFT